MYPKATAAVKGIEESTDILVRDLKKLRNHPGLPGITGTVYGRTPSVSGDSINAQALYDSVTSKGTLNMLNAVRAASPTGGALGTISDKDVTLLKDTQGLSRVQETKEFRNKIGERIAEVEDVRRRAREAYNMTYEYKTKKEGTTGTWKDL
jgi:hypothetical protein